MKGRLGWLGLTAVAALLLSEGGALAQPPRNFPGSRSPALPGAPPPMFPPANERVRQAANQVGFQSADFYGKNGYPKVLGDAVEQGNQAQGSGAGGGAGGGQGGGAAGGGGGFQGNIGNQIGSQSGGTLFGGIFGVRTGPGFTGGGFTGAVPKGFGFGGTPDHSRAPAPLGGGFNR